MNQKVVLIIPARFNSSRFPGKPLADLLGKPVIQHVYERALMVTLASKVVVATDDVRIADCVRGFGGAVEMTSPEHPSGTDRLVEVMGGGLDGDIYVNLQGDEPLIRPEDVDLLIQGMLKEDSIDIGTLYHAIDADEADNPNAVKLVLADNGNALYFSRFAVPFNRDQEDTPNYYKHIGIYGYRREVLQAYAQLPESPLESAEKLEQLRFLSAGYTIRAFEVEPTGPGVDTPECLEVVKSILLGVPRGRVVAAHSEFKQIKLVITDVDGVLTDGTLYYSETGESLKGFNVKDGLGISLLRRHGIEVAILSGRDSPGLRRRMQDLGITLFRVGEKDKAVGCEAIIAEVGVSASDTLFIGDDLIDLPAFATCGLSCAVKDAPDYIHAQVDVVLDAEGGRGAFREVADKILQAQGQGDYFGSSPAAASTKNLQQ
jgi:3-deoxy-D-manno-octulosonate 8-phosphate phosphatase (KDO 8-P phosphatase)